ncbi:hypothetical protein WPS_11860 [Vulcanimicrobium alpinum]|uniref:ABC transmembrane type-1 domain-containing protein n=1 Tax=Vulcanimicrobium alpinum TaxID=3016050 RepID=A0AAN2C8W4_UNVUL|nr:ABC transporter permease subunit [Vulcanimicrobium alpinum]BDE05910.1 hypothetical protein WPS_11860 [Vulcanimicrobium alpinum]
MSAVLRIRLVTAAAVLTAYEAAARSGLFYQGVFPPLGAVGRALAATLAAPQFYANLEVTATEIAAGFAIGAVLGVPAGVALGAGPRLRAAFAPYVDAFATAPKVIWLPIAMLALGAGPASKAALAAAAAFFPIVIAVAAGTRHVPAVYVRVARVAHASAWQRLRWVYLPALRVPIVTGLRLGFGLAVTIVLLAEIKISDRGAGFLVIDAYNHFRIAEMDALLIVLFALAVAANGAMGRLAEET